MTRYLYAIEKSRKIAGIIIILINFSRICSYRLSLWYCPSNHTIFPTDLFVLYVNLNTFIIENKNGQLHQGA